MTRVDLFTTIHKGIRALLFDAATEAARVDVRSNFAVDALAERVERMLGFVEEHAQHEDAEIQPLLRTVDPAVANLLLAEHRELEAAHHEVCRAVRRLGLAPPSGRRSQGQELLRLLNHLTAKQLLHMNYEETVINAVLWGGFGDPELEEARARIHRRVKADRLAEWGAVLAPVLDPPERALVLGEEIELESGDLVRELSSVT